MSEPVLNTVVEGDVLAVLARLAAGWFHMACFSPPYWGLRSYLDLPAAAWGRTVDCPHSWGDALPRPGNEYRDGLGAHSEFAGRTDKAEIRDSFRRDRAGVVPKIIKGTGHFGNRDNPSAGKPVPSGGAFCQLCGAWKGMLGLEPLHDCGSWARGEPPCASCFVCHMRAVFAGLWRVLRDDGTVFLNMGDSYASTGSGAGQDNSKASAGPRCDGFRHPAYLNQKNPRTAVGGLKPKDLCGVPWRVALALQADGWFLRSDIIWHKRSCMPSSVTDRPTTAHEYIFLLAKRKDYFWDAEAVRQKGSDASVGRDRYPFTGIQQPRGHPSGRGQTGRQDQQVSGSRNIRTVWGDIRPEPSNYDFCDGCGSLFIGSDRKGIRVQGKGTDDERRVCPHCGEHDKWVAHYAAFPSGLPRRCILAGTSAAGCCPDCGKPWERAVEREAGESGASANSNRAAGAVAAGQGGHGSPTSTLAIGGAGHGGAWADKGSHTSTLGWQPACDCGPPHAPMPLAPARQLTVPCRVLDPFSGTGTTPLVAAQLGRDWLAIEGSPSYARMSRERIRVLGTRKAKAMPAEAMPLFAAKGEQDA